MTKHEFEKHYNSAIQEMKSRVDKISAHSASGRKLESEEYEIIEIAYIALDVDKPIFAKMVLAMGIDEVIAKANKWVFIRDSADHYNEYRRYVKAKEALDEQQRAVEHSKQIIENYEKKIRQN